MFTILLEVSHWELNCLDEAVPSCHGMVPVAKLVDVSCIEHYHCFPFSL